MEIQVSLFILVNYFHYFWYLQFAFIKGRLLHEEGYLKAGPPFALLAAHHPVDHPATCVVQRPVA